MKAIRNLKVILVVLIVILISVISFGGIYYVNKGRMTNRLPDYILGSNIKGYRHVTLVASEDTQENKNNTNGIIATELFFISCPKNINKPVARTTNNSVNGLVKSNTNIYFSPYL